MKCISTRLKPLNITNCWSNNRSTTIKRRRSITRKGRVERCRELIVDIGADVISDENDERALKDLDSYIKYVEFIGGGSINARIEPSTRDKVIELFSSASLGQENREERLELLKSSLEGLVNLDPKLKKKQTIADIEREVMEAEAKKAASGGYASS